MKRILLTLWLVVTAVINVMSQSDNCVLNIDQNKEMVYLYVDSQKYTKLSNLEKTNLINKQSDIFNAKSICVVRDHQTELWMAMDGSMKMVDYWDKDSVTSTSSKKAKRAAQRRSLQHPWFFNISGTFMYESTFLSYDAYGRIGCYLLKGRWDMAVNIMTGYSKIKSETKGNFGGSIGIDSRVYILKGKAVNPFLGAGVAYAFGEGNSSVTIPLSTGLSIPIKGKSSIDVCYQYNNVTKSAVVIGYTQMH